MEVHSDRHDQNDRKNADYGSDAHRHVAAVYTETEYDRDQDEQDRDHRYGCRSRGFRHIKCAALIVHCAEGRSNDRSEGCYD